MAENKSLDEASDESVLSYSDDHRISSSPEGSVVDPSTFDILLGRGKSNMNHSGNKHYQALIKANCLQYSSVQTLQEKTAIITEILETVTAKGRFLQKDKTGSHWVTSSPKTVRAKVAHALQYCRRRVPKGKANAQHNSGQRTAETEQVVLSTEVHQGAYMCRPMQGELPAENKRYASFPATDLVRETEKELREDRTLGHAELAHTHIYGQATIPPAAAVQPEDQSRETKGMRDIRSSSLVEQLYGPTHNQLGHEASRDQVLSAQVSPCRQEIATSTEDNRLTDAVRPLDDAIDEFFAEHGGSETTGIAGMSRAHSTRNIRSLLHEDDDSP